MSILFYLTYGGNALFEITEKKKEESAKDYVVRTLIYNLVHTNLIPGQQLYDQELCSQMNVSRTPFREGVLELAQRQLIDIRPKIGTYVSFIDPDIVEEIRHLRSVLESELAVLACSCLTEEDINRLWENIALWKMYIQRNQEEKIFALDKDFHRLIYESCHHMYWHRLVENVAPHFDRTTILSFRCKPLGNILADHEELVCAFEQRNPALAQKISRRHLERYRENLSAIRETFPEYFQK